MSCYIQVLKDLIQDLLQALRVLRGLMDPAVNILRLIVTAHYHQSSEMKKEEESEGCDTERR